TPEFIDHLKIADETQTRLSIGNGEIIEVVFKRRHLLSPNYQATRSNSESTVALDHPISNNFVVERVVDGSQIARINLTQGLLNGLFFDGQEKYRLTPMANVASTKDEGKYVLYRGKEGESIPLSFCGVDQIPIEGSAKASSNARNAGMATCHVIEIATESDFELFQKYGNNAQQTIQHVLDQFNIVEGIYLNSGIDLSFAIVYQNVWTSIFDPYFATERFAMRNEFKDVWNNAIYGFTDVDRDVAYMVSGKVNTNGGAAFTSTAGDPALAYAVGQEFDSETDEHLIAHEIGHTLSAGHDTSGTVCISGNKPLSGTMCSFVGTQGFSANSVSEISTYLDSSNKFGAITSATIFALGAITDIRSYVARENLTLHMTVAGSGYVRAIAGQRITLPPGFRANDGSHFRAFINQSMDGCN
ncbi:MAG: M12 family metallo-peptidase, partial [Saprospiraceae bacterium]|nr:M12 family metallo-peptidase [Saprospiraceae bacterium]